MNKVKIALAAWALIGLVALVHAANIAPTPGQILTSPVTVSPGSVPYNGGPQTSAIQASGGTFTCTSGGVITVADTYLDATSVVLLGIKTANSPGNVPYLTTVTPGTGFTITCASGDTSIYNYIVLG